jgi:hypothetical protein
MLSSEHSLAKLLLALALDALLSIVEHKYCGTKWLLLLEIKMNYKETLATVCLFMFNPVQSSDAGFSWTQLA